MLNHHFSWLNYNFSWLNYHFSCLNPMKFSSPTSPTGSGRHHPSPSGRVSSRAQGALRGHLRRGWRDRFWHGRHTCGIPKRRPDSVDFHAVHDLITGFAEDNCFCLNRNSTMYSWGFLKQIQVLLGRMFPSLLNMFSGGPVLGEA